ncbi:Na+/H+ antiporter subunit E [Tahibacter harae]|uniref:Na+/H+ antiporter subunit E n=1 Tax=Tahibacter harae TaxID=2963937 RepID=A0ABT1QKP7_9GAMM|nr:Na+/H+ antiporter subunit E [Tahibacter harae]MCQ4163104.1 Na+/H+ antiporter subunit E [Tahibacter harae]
MRLLNTLLPAPWLSGMLLGTWLVLARTVTPGQFSLGLLLALGIPHLFPKLQLSGIRLRRPAVALRFIARVAGDVVVSNVAVARDVIRWRWRKPASRFVVIPLDLRDPLGLAALALVTTIVPGTVWSELAADRSALLLHVWDVQEESDFVLQFKARYEQPLREIFE